MATVSGVQNVGRISETRTVLEQQVATIGGGFVVLVLLAFLLRFDNMFTYLIAFSRNDSCLGMIWVLVFSMKKTPKLETDLGHIVLIRVTVFISSIGAHYLQSADGEYRER